MSQIAPIPPTPLTLPYPCARSGGEQLCLCGPGCTEARARALALCCEDGRQKMDDDVEGGAYADGGSPSALLALLTLPVKAAYSTPSTRAIGTVLDLCMAACLSAFTALRGCTTDARVGVHDASRRALTRQDSPRKAATPSTRTTGDSATKLHYSTEDTPPTSRTTNSLALPFVVRIPVLADQPRSCLVRTPLTILPCHSTEGARPCEMHLQYALRTRNGGQDTVARSALRPPRTSRDRVGTNAAHASYSATRPPTQHKSRPRAW
ncbi:hypothetical protein BDW22DRAFT_1347793 [Trametopsis cervina]|nr:hypothetical protein BDW22DRAFT_1347793 [Trametopsis cervina]